MEHEHVKICIRAETILIISCTLHPISPVEKLYQMPMPMPALKDSVLSHPGLTNSTRKFWINLISLTLCRLSTFLPVGYVTPLEVSQNSVVSLQIKTPEQDWMLKCLVLNYVFLSMGAKGEKAQEHFPCSNYPKQVCGVSIIKSQNKFKFLYENICTPNILLQRVRSNHSSLW